MSYASISSVFATANPNQPMGWPQVILFAILLSIVYFVILLPVKRKQKKVQEFQDGLKVGDKVITIGGIYGQITRVSDNTVQLQVADKVRIEVARTSMAGLQGQDPVVTDGGNL
jgi:preprotein translocase subunit YajC